MKLTDSSGSLAPIHQTTRRHIQHDRTHKLSFLYFSYIYLMTPDEHQKVTD